MRVRTRSWIVWSLAAAALVLFAWAGPARAQYDHTLTSTTTLVPDPTGYVQFSLIDALLESIPGTGPPEDSGWNPGGSWGLAIGPADVPNFGRPIAGVRYIGDAGGNHPHFRYTNQVVVGIRTFTPDPTTGVITPDPDTFWNLPANTALLGHAAAGTVPEGHMIIPPPSAVATEQYHKVGARTVQGIWAIPIDDPSTLVATQWAQVFERYTVLRDTLRCEFVITNLSYAGPIDPATGAPTPPARSMSVGMRIFLDATFGDLLNPTDGQPIFTFPAHDAVTTDFVFSDDPLVAAPPVPDSWTAFQTGSASGATGIALKGTLSGNDVDDPAFATFAAGPPDTLQIGRAAALNGGFQWNFVPVPIPFVGQNWGVAVRWDLVDTGTLQPGQSMRFVTYYGRGEATSEFRPPFVLALESPLALEAKPGDDPLTAEVENFFYTVDAADPAASSVIPITGFANNTREPSQPTDVGLVTLMLPTNLGLVITDAAGTPIPGAGSTYSIAVGQLAANTEAVASFYIRVPPGTPPGVHPVRLAAGGKLVERPLTIPALPEFGIDRVDVVRRLNMMSVPYDFVDRDAENILGTLQGPPPLDPDANALGLARWDPVFMGYRFWPNPFILTIEPGEGFWVYNPPGAAPPIEQLVLPNPPDRQELTAATPVPIQRGWNQIGTVFTRPSNWSATRFQVGTAPAVDFDEAVSRGYILPVLFWYDTTTGDYDFEPAPSLLRLDPYVGYWLYAYRDLTMVLQPPTAIVGRAVGPRAAPRQPTLDDWRVELVASVPGIARSKRFLGVAPEAQDDYDPSDILDPPAPQALDGHLALFFPHSQWGERSGNFRCDFRAPGLAEQTWDVLVQTDRPNENVTLTWPSIKEVPKDYGIMLEDLDAQVSRSMRTTVSYTFNSGLTGGDRHLRIHVTSARAGEPRIADFQFVPARGAGAQGEMVFSLNVDAVVDLRIRNIAGRLVRQLARQQQCRAGRQVIPWDGRNEHGNVVPNGIYLGEIAARTEPGARATAIRTFVVVR